MKRIIRISLGSLVAIAAIGYLADYLSLRFAIPHRDQYDSVDVKHFYAVKLKNKQTNYMFDREPQPTECVNSLFPHFGDNPCWYTKRHTTVQVTVDGGPFGAWIDTP